MTPLVLPLTVRTDGDDLDLLISVPEPITWAAIAPAVLGCAGLSAGTTMYLGIGPVEGSWLLGIAPLLAGTIVSTEPQNRAVATGSVNLSCIAGPDAGGWAGIGDGPVIIGRHRDCDLSIDDPELSRWHARVEMGSAGLLVADLSSANGIKVDGVRQPRDGPSGAAPAGGLVQMGGSVLRIGLDTEPGLLVTPDGAGHLRVARPARVAPAFHFALPDPVGPPPVRSRRPLPLLAAAIGGLAGVAIAVVTGLWSFLLLAALGPVMMLSTALSDRLGGRRSHRRELADHRRALASQELIRDAAVDADRADAWDRYPDPATLARRARSRSSRLWERRPEHPDFLRLCVGIGRRPARVVSDHRPVVPEVPITLDLGQIGVLGLAGDCRPLLRHLLAQLTALHSPADLQLSIFSDRADLARLRDLPHTATGGRPGVLQNERAVSEVSRLLGRTDEGPMTVVILDDAHRWRRTPRMNELLTQAARPTTAGAGLREHHGDHGVGQGGQHRLGPPGPRVVAICVAEAAQALPAECTAVAVVRSGVVEFAAGAVSGRVEATGVCAIYLEEMISALAPLLDPDAAGVGLPPVAVLAQINGGGFPDLIDTRWARPDMVAVLGLAVAGPITVDLERDGPHLLIAGTTGSGKSELLRTLIAGLALAAPPDRTSFLLIDYKGGAAFGPLADLPHTAGMVTDLDVVLAARALTGLRSEVRRREQLLADHRLADIVELRRQMRPGCPPALVIVVDEFATLGAELPTFLAGLLDVAQRGRSLGMHLVLATQRPAGVLSPAIKANIGLRICLRVTDDADSVDVIDTPEAARLGAGHAGRALLRSERGRTTMFQVAMVSCTGGGPTVARRDARDTVSARSAVPTGSTGPTDLDLIVDAARLKAGRLPPARPPWTPLLPDRYTPPDPEVVALLDEPAEQRQIALPTPPGSIMLLGPPGSGRSCGLRRLAFSAAHRGAALLVIDPGASLADLARWPSTRTYLDGDDPTLVQRLVQRLQEILRDGPASSGSPGTAGSEMLLLVDGWDAISGALETLDFGATIADLADLAGRGPAAGLRVAISGDLRMQHHRTAGAFTTIVRFGADERGEVRRGVPGRGFLGPAEIQWAYAPPGFTGPNPALLPRGPVIRPLPARVGLQALSRPTAPTGTAGSTADAAPVRTDLNGLVASTADPAAVPIGVGDDDAATQTVDLHGPGGGLLVAGPRRSGVSTTLLVLGTGALAAGIPVLRPHVRPLEPLAGARDLDLRPGPAELERLLAEHEGPILLLADDLVGTDRPADDSGRPGSVAALLERFVLVAGAGQYLALGTRLDRAHRALRGPIAEVAAMRYGVLLQADSADGGILDTVLPRRRGHILPGRGHLVRAGTVIRLQVADPRSPS